MKELLLAVQASVFMEFERAAKKFGKANNSLHESYAVILEEVEEAEFEAGVFKDQLEYFWKEVKGNNPGALLRLKTKRDFAEQAAANDLSCRWTIHPVVASAILAHDRDQSASCIESKILCG
ncbi:MAG: hypothetical protein Q8919_06590 [Bacteroidota bacterium]|nr:hypothetical protein [Bacteroidota bacterium]